MRTMARRLDFHDIYISTSNTNNHVNKTSNCKSIETESETHHTFLSSFRFTGLNLLMR